MSWRYLVGLILALAAIAAATEEAGVSIRDAWVREAPPGATMMAGYMVLKNNTPRSQVLVAARSSGFGTVMIHRTVVKGGLTGMEHAPKIELLPNASLLFEPGEYTRCFPNPKRDFQPAARVDITLKFF